MFFTQRKRCCFSNCSQILLWHRCVSLLLSKVWTNPFWSDTNLNSLISHCLSLDLSFILVLSPLFIPHMPVEMTGRDKRCVCVSSLRWKIRVIIPRPVGASSTTYKPLRKVWGDCPSKYVVVCWSTLRSCWYPAL